MKTIKKSVLLANIPATVVNFCIESLYAHTNKSLYVDDLESLGSDSKALACLTEEVEAPAVKMAVLMNKAGVKTIEDIYSFISTGKVGKGTVELKYLKSRGISNPYLVENGNYLMESGLTDYPVAEVFTSRLHAGLTLWSLVKKKV